MGVRVSVVVGNPSPRGRTTRAGEAVAEAVVGVAGGGTIDVHELADHIEGIFEWQNDRLDELTASVATSDVIVAATPNYKQSYTGLLKAFFDRYGDDGLAGTISVPVMVGAAPTQALAVEMHLRPLLVALGSTVPTAGLYLLADRIDDVEAVVAEWSRRHAEVLRRSLG